MSGPASRSHSHTLSCINRAVGWLVVGQLAGLKPIRRHGMWQWEVVSTVVFAVEEQQRPVVSEYAENEEVESRTHTQRTLPEETTQSRAAFLPYRWSACGGGGGRGLGVVTEA